MMKRPRIVFALSALKTNTVLEIGEFMLGASSVSICANCVQAETKKMYHFMNSIYSFLNVYIVAELSNFDGKNRLR